MQRLRSRLSSAAAGVTEAPDEFASNALVSNSNRGIGLDLDIPARQDAFHLVKRTGHGFGYIDRHPAIQPWIACCRSSRCRDPCHFDEPEPATSIPGGPAYPGARGRGSPVGDAAWLTAHSAACRSVRVRSKSRCQQTRLNPPVHVRIVPHTHEAGQGLAPSRILKSGRPSARTSRRKLSSPVRWTAFDIAQARGAWYVQPVQIGYEAMPTRGWHLSSARNSPQTICITSW